MRGVSLLALVLTVAGAPAAPLVFDGPAPLRARLSVDTGDGGRPGSLRLETADEPLLRLDPPATGRAAGGAAVVTLCERTEAGTRLVLDLTALVPGARRALRRVCYRPPSVVVADEVELDAPAELALGLEGAAWTEVMGSEVTAMGGLADARAQVVAPTLLRGTVAERAARLATPAPVTRAVFLTVLTATGKAERPPSVRPHLLPGGAEIWVGPDLIDYRLNESLALHGVGQGVAR